MLKLAPAKRAAAKAAFKSDGQASGRKRGEDERALGFLELLPSMKAPAWKSASKSFSPVQCPRHWGEMPTAALFTVPTLPARGLGTPVQVPTPSGLWHCLSQYPEHQYPLKETGEVQSADGPGLLLSSVTYPKPHTALGSFASRRQQTGSFLLPFNSGTCSSLQSSSQGGLLFSCRKHWPPACFYRACCSALVQQWELNNSGGS